MKMPTLLYRPTKFIIITVISIFSLLWSDDRISEERNVKNFDSVHLTGSGQLTIVQGNAESLQVEADTELMQYIKTEVKNGILVLGLKNRKWRRIFHFDSPIHYYLTLKDLKRLRLSGSGAIEADRIKSDKLSITISGSGDVEIANLNAKDLDVEISGSGECHLTGKVPHQSVTISGSADYAAGKLISEFVDVTVSGSGDATVWAVEELEIRVSGSGNVDYYGHPRIYQRVSGSGDIRQLGEK
jgi:hypothetical protein